MRIPSPAIQWPAELLSTGPDRDPDILLTGDARVAGIRFRVAALRVRKGLRTPDYRADVPLSDYETALDSMQDDVEDLIGSLSPELVPLNGTDYLLWMVPFARD